MPHTILRMPETDDELWEFVYTVWGFRIPRVAVCEGHCAPFEAFADAYFARHPVAIWKASRGLGGKSTMLGTLSSTEVVALACQISVLGGSASQSQRVHEVTNESWTSPLAPAYLLAKEPTMYFTHLVNGGRIKAQAASQTSVRGDHPLRLRLDEIDEMELAILEAAQGQPMDTTEEEFDKDGEFIGIKTIHKAQTVMSSTHQYPDKTMTTKLAEARKRGWPVFEWCYKESMGTPEHPGWLTQEQVDRKRQEISAAMWAIEFDLQEPSFAGRAIEAEKVDWSFNVNLYTGKHAEDGTPLPVEGEEGEKYIFEKPVQEFVLRNKYVTGIDWAKEQDWTIISTYLTDCVPWRCVAWRRTGRLPWPVMLGYAEDRLDMYKGFVVHDATGIGGVLGDMIDYDEKLIEDFVMVGSARTLLFNEYIKAIESGEIQSPRVMYAYNEHKYVTVKDLYGPGHPPDSVVAGALAWSARDRIRAGTRVMAPVSVTRDGSPWK